jgi:hypothetical protein
MKHTLTVLLALTLCLTLLSGCFKPSPLKFDFSFEVEKETFTRGETVQITATVTNVSGRTYRYQGCSGNDFIPRISLYCGTEDQTYEIPCDPIVLPEDVIEKKVKSGESGSIVYSFVIPADARLGKYSLTLSYGEDTKIFGDALSVIEVTAQNENEKFDYTSTRILSGDNAIFPIKNLLNTTYYENRQPTLSGCGDGAYEIFNDSQTSLSELPVLVSNGRIEVLPPVNVLISRIRVYDINYQETEYNIQSFGELATLPTGEYLIVYVETIDGRGCDDEIKDYWITNNENLFRLVIQ